MSNELALMREIAKLQEQINALRTIETGWHPVPLTTPLTSTSYDGNDTVATGTVTIDTSSVFGAPAGIKMCALQLQATWASASATNIMAIRITGTTDTVCNIRAHTTYPQDGYCIVPCDANGDFDLYVVGANATNVVLRIWAYWK